MGGASNLFVPEVVGAFTTLVGGTVGFSVGGRVCLVLLFVLSFAMRATRSRRIAGVRVTTASAIPACADSSTIVGFLGSTNVPVARGDGLGLLGDNQTGFVSLFRRVQRTGRRVRLRCFGFHGSSVTGTLFSLLKRGIGRKIRIETLFSTFNGLSGGGPLGGGRVRTVHSGKVRVIGFSPFGFPCVGRTLRESRHGVMIVSKGVKCANNVGVTGCCVGNLPRVNS